MKNNSRKSEQATFMIQREDLLAFQLGLKNKARFGFII